MKKFLLTFALGCACAAYATAADPVEIDGLYYNLYPNDGDGTATLVRPPSGMYSGAVTLNPEVSYEGTSYQVNGRTAFGALNPSEITEFTLGEGWPDGLSLTNISFMNNTTLEKITLKSFFTTYFTMNTGNNAVIQVNLRRISETETQLIVADWNVYGPDGEKLVPCLYTENPGQEPIYPDRDGVFHLNGNWQTPDGQYCGILPMGMGKYTANYWVVLLDVYYEGKKVTLRTQPKPYYTGQFVVDNGIKYMFNYDHFAVYGLAEGAEWPEVIDMPASLEFEGMSYPVKALCYGAFENSTSRFIKLPASINELSSYSFSLCPNLERVDLSAVNVDLFNYCLFSNCASLEEVVMPETPVTMDTPFINCPLLKNVRIPKNSTIKGICQVCPSLANVEIIENSEETVRVKFESTIEFGEEFEVEYRLRTAANTSVSYTLENGVFTFPRTSLYDDSNKFKGTINIVANDKNDNSVEFNVCSDYVPEETSAVEMVGADNNSNAPVEYFTINGMRVNGKPSAPGVYIRRQGSQIEKLLLK